MEKKEAFRQRQGLTDLMRRRRRDSSDNLPFDPDAEEYDEDRETP